MIEVSTTLLNVLRSRSRDLSLVCEIYDPSVEPGVDGFDPADALECFASVSGIEFRGQTYRKQIVKFGDVKRSAGKQFNTCSVTLSNVDRYAASFILNNDLEGCGLVIRLLSRSASTNLNDSLLVFFGAIESPIEASKTEVRIHAKQYGQDVEQEIPPRKYVVDDPEGRASTDIYNEGFRFLPQFFTATYKEKVPKGGLLGALGFKKTVTRNLQYSSHSDLDANESVPVLMGRVQILLKAIATLDVGAKINTVYSAADGMSYGIAEYVSLRNNTPGFSQPGVGNALYHHFGYRSKEGEGVRKQEPVPLVGVFPGNGYYSRTVWVAIAVSGSEVGREDGAPEISAVMLGAQVPLPDASGNFLASTGSISSTTTPTVLTVSRTGYRNGDLLRVAGAGQSGGALYARVVSGGGTTTLTLEHPASTTVTGAQVRKIGWTDNPAYLRRWVRTDPYLMGQPEAFIDDASVLETAAYQNQYIEDEANTEVVRLDAREEGRVGTDFHLYHSTARVSPAWWRREFMGDLAVSPYVQEIELGEDDFFDPAAVDPDDPPPEPDPAIYRHYRRRYTANCPVTDTQKAVDFLNDVLDVAGRMYTTTGANGKERTHVRKPVDNSTLRGDTAALVTSVPVKSVLAWIDDLSGKIVVGAQLATAEAREVTGYAFSTDGNSIPLTASGGVTASGPTLSGCDGIHTPATATLTVTTNTGTKNVTVDGVALSHVSQADDTTASIALMLAAMVNARPNLNTHVKASWDAASPNVVTLSSKLGSLTLANHLLNEHDAGEEVLRVASTFAAADSDAADRGRSNVLRNTFKWVQGNRQGTFNRVEIKFRDASQDYKLTPLRIPRLNEVTPPVKMKEVNGAAVDNFHQAYRIAAQAHAEITDGNFSASLSGDGESLLLDPGDVIAITDPSGGFVNLLILVNEVTVTGDLAVNVSGTRYLTSMFTDTVEQRNVPLPTTLAYQSAAPGAPTNLVLAEIEQNATSSTVRGTFDFAGHPRAQAGRVFIKRAGTADFEDLGLIIAPDSDDAGSFEVAGLTPGTHEFKVRSESHGLVSDYSATEDITTATSGELEVSELVITGSGGIEFTGGAAEATRGNLGAASQIERFYGY